VTQVNERRQPRSASEEEWLRVRGYLREHRYDLSVSASVELYPDVPRVAGTPLLAAMEWLPAEPIPLERIALGLDPDIDPFAGQPPVRPAGLPRPRYSEAIGELAAPAVFENRKTYRLLDADLRGPRPRMSFGRGRYFDGIDTGEAVAHEYAAQKLGAASTSDLRDAIGSPVDPARRPTNVAISALTIRHDRRTDEACFLLHWRDPAKVGHAGGLYQVIPVGIFQPATEHPDSLRTDFSLWRCLVREFAEELLGEAEADPDAGPIDYDGWSFAADLRAEQCQGTIRTYCLGMGVDPLTLATDLLCVVVIEAEVFDRIFGGLVDGNAEGELAGQQDGRPGVPFVASEVERLTKHEPMQAAGAAVLASAWEHRAALLQSR
jgi:hypothetical protein